MSAFGTRGLLLTTVVPPFIVIVFTIWRMTQRKAAAESEKTDFVTTTPLRTAAQTPTLVVPESD